MASLVRLLSASFFLSSVDAPSLRVLLTHLFSYPSFFSLLQGHTPFWDNTFDFNADEPASLLMPLFWSSLTLLLLVDLLHFRCQRLTKQLNLTTLTRFCSTKIRLTFGQTFSEAAMSSLVVAAFCCMLHARNLTLQQNENYDQDLFQLLIDLNQHDRVLQYARCFLEIETSTMPPWMSSPIFGVWMSCMSILVVHHWFDRTCEERGWLTCVFSAFFFFLPFHGSSLHLRVDALSIVSFFTHALNSFSKNFLISHLSFFSSFSSLFSRFILARRDE